MWLFREPNHRVLWYHHINKWYYMYNGHTPPLNIIIHTDEESTHTSPCTGLTHAFWYNNHTQKVCLRTVPHYSCTILRYFLECTNHVWYNTFRFVSNTQYILLSRMTTSCKRSNRRTSGFVRTPRNRWGMFRVCIHSSFFRFDRTARYWFNSVCLFRQWCHFKPVCNVSHQFDEKRSIFAFATLNCCRAAQ